MGSATVPQGFAERHWQQGFTRSLVVLLILAIGAVWLWKLPDWEDMLSARASPWIPPPAPAPAMAAAPRVACADSDPLRRAWFGDLHVHTAFSMDARSRDMLSTPDDAYRFARGDAVGLGPFDESGVGTRIAQLERPLDFAAVTDHAEWMGEIALCTTPGSPTYDVHACAALRGEVEAAPSLVTLIGGRARLLNVVGLGDRKSDICGPDNVWCRSALKSAWTTTQEAAERHYDRSSDCSFTTFHGYEYSNSRARSKVHRNVIFRNERVPELPVSSLEQMSALGLWEQLDLLCNNTGSDCEAIAIPHNPNVSNGRMFYVPWRDAPLQEQVRQAKLRARLEPVVEMMQVKGESECKNGLWQVFGEDELCDFEKLRVGLAEPKDCEGGYSSGAIMGRGCGSRLDFARYALIEGMVEEQRIGVNPYRFGFVGSTDSHNATPGDVGEDGYQGCCANADTSLQQRLGADGEFAGGFAGRPPAARNPGGLMGVWAEENSRDSLFDAMLRREVFATSGPRLVPRFFVGESLPEEICRGGLAASGYAGGVPMGGVIERTLTSSPLFAAAVDADPMGGHLQRMQIVKVWFDAEGRFHQAVHDIAGSPDNGATVDLTTCEVSGPGERQLCATWRDPDFDPNQSAAWYMRAVENPSCRWSWRQCLSLPESERPAACSSADIPAIIQERVWTSPVWYSPSA
ncbi:MAG: DUF3604 domain-containing protein [Pseudomonadota bacterium]